MFVQGSTTNSAMLLGSESTASGDCSVAEGYGSTASGPYSHAEGGNTTASGEASHAEGVSTKAYFTCSHAEGYSTVSAGLASHAEGWITAASGPYSHAEGSNTVASGYASHAEGEYTAASGPYSHVEGSNTVASGDYSHASGYHTVAGSTAMTAIGQYNKTQSGALFVVGNGANNATSDALVLTNDGVLTLASTCNASAFYETSDLRKKNIIEDLSLDRCYDLIDKCQTIIYTLKDDSSNKQQLGLIAQEVNEIFPELVVIDTEGMMTLDYSRITVVCLRVLKELINRIKRLEERND